MRRLIPAQVIATLSEVLPGAETHDGIDNLFRHAGAPGDSPEGSKRVKVQEWLRRVNRDEDAHPLDVLGRLVEPIMEADCDAAFDGDTRRERKARVEATLARCQLHYVDGGRIVGALGPASRSLNDLIRSRNVSALDEELGRALRNVDANPREAVSAACNILESVCKVYIEDEGLTMPAKQDLQGVWGIVRKDLGLDPSILADRDLKEILSGLLGVVGGIGALRTHASSAHGAGRAGYRLAPRHARLAVHSAHTVAAYILEAWEHKKGKPSQS